jgi:hypothetical protein
VLLVEPDTTQPNSTEEVVEVEVEGVEDFTITTITNSIEEEVEEEGAVATYQKGH